MKTQARGTRGLLGLCAATTLAISPVPVAAQQALEEVIVTAQKRDETAQEIPMSISVLGNELLGRAGFANVTDVANYVPNLSFSYGSSSQIDAAVSLSVRGIVGGNTTGLYIDESPLLESLNPRIIDLERVEVLRGPQGTLYGARAMGGTIRMITRQPSLDATEGYIRTDISSTNGGSGNHLFSAAVNLPLANDLAAVRVMAFTEEESGFIDRSASADAPASFDRERNVNDLKAHGGMISGLLALQDGDLRIAPRVAYQRVERGGRPVADIDPGNRTMERLFNFNEESDTDWTLGTLTASYASTFGEFVSASSWYQRDIQDSEDFSEWTQAAFGLRLPSFITATIEEDMVAQEFRFSSDFSGPFQITAGLFYQDQDSARVFPPAQIPGIGSAIGLPNDTIFFLSSDLNINEKAAYFQSTLDLTPSITLTAGLRYFDNKVTFDLVQGGGFIGPEEHFGGVQAEDGFNPKIGIEYQVSDQHLIYASASKGFRTGGVNFFSNQLCGTEIASTGLTPQGLQSFDSDKLWNYETGFKSLFKDRRIMLNATAFFVDWSDLQQALNLACGFTVVTNTGSAESVGFEMEVAVRATDNLRLNASAGYVDAEITDAGLLLQDIEGKSLQDVPDWTFSLGLDYEFKFYEWPSYLHFDYTYTGDSTAAIGNSDPLRARDAYALTNIRIGSTIGSWDLSFFVNNLFDEEANYGVTLPMGVETPGRPRVAVNRPRTIGAGLVYSF